MLLCFSLFDILYLKVITVLLFLLFFLEIFATPSSDIYVIIRKKIIVLFRCTNFRFFLKFFSFAEMTHNKDDIIEYDYIVIGGGTSGAVVARRLAETNDNYSVCLLEAGPKLVCLVLIDMF